MMEYSVGLALYDFVPVIFTGVAVVYLARLVAFVDGGNGRWAYVGAGLVTLAGVTKATWKLIAAVAGQDLVWLANLLFPLMGPGFVLLAAGIWLTVRSLRGKSAPGWVWLLPVVAIVVAYGAAGVRMWVWPTIERGWFMPMMALASLGNFVLTGVLMVMAGRRGRWGLAALFVVNLGMVFVLIPIAQIEPKTIGLHWFEQTLTSGGAAAFALASYGLYRLVVGGERPVQGSAVVTLTQSS